MGKLIMASQNYFTEKYFKLSYKDLLKEKDFLSSKIYNIEKRILNIDANKKDFFQLNLYTSYLKEMSLLCKLIDDKFCKNYIIQNKEEQYIYTIKKILKTNNKTNKLETSPAYIKRQNKEVFSINDHIKALIYSLLSNQREWYRIENRLPTIDAIFENYDPQILKIKKPSDLSNQIFELKCGNINTTKQMINLSQNIKIFESIEIDYESLDNYVTSKSAYDIAQELSSPKSKYKLKSIGVALAWEYLKNIGIDGAKPDTHLRRFFSNKRMGKSTNRNPATEKEVFVQIEELAKDTKLSKIEIDKIIWNFCANGKGEICTAFPNCNKCIISNYCNVGK